MKATFGLLQAYQEPVALWPPMPVPADPLDATLSLRTYAFSAPWLSVISRALTTILGLAALLAAIGALAMLRRKGA